jgi:DNA repair exonuclease SbcCD nuclease subunit
MAAPVIYPGSVERTSFAERFEQKYYVKLSFIFVTGNPAPELTIEYIPLPARPMVVLKIEGSGLTLGQLTTTIRDRLSSLEPDAVVKLKIEGSLAAETNASLSAGYLRRLAPPTMNINLGYDSALYSSKQSPSLKSHES